MQENLVAADPLADEALTPSEVQLLLESHGVACSGDRLGSLQDISAACDVPLERLSRTLLRIRMLGLSSMSLPPTAERALALNPSKAVSLSELLNLPGQRPQMNVSPTTLEDDRSFLRRHGLNTLFAVASLLGASVLVWFGLRSPLNKPGAPAEETVGAPNTEVKPAAPSVPFRTPADFDPR